MVTITSFHLVFASVRDVGSNLILWIPGPHIHERSSILNANICFKDCWWDGSLRLNNSPQKTTTYMPQNRHLREERSVFHKRYIRPFGTLRERGLEYPRKYVLPIRRPDESTLSGSQRTTRKGMEISNTPHSLYPSTFRRSWPLGGQGQWFPSEVYHCLADICRCDRLQRRCDSGHTRGYRIGPVLGGDRVQIPQHQYPYPKSRGE